LHPKLSVIKFGDLQSKTDTSLTLSFVLGEEIFLPGMSELLFLYEKLERIHPSRQSYILCILFLFA
jgi:hypothetical protein